MIGYKLMMTGLVLGIVGVGLVTAIGHYPGRLIATPIIAMVIACPGLLLAGLIVAIWEW